MFEIIILLQNNIEHLKNNFILGCGSSETQGLQR